MRKFIMFMVLLTTGAQLFAQVTISGKVKDNRGRPVTAATITLKDTYDGAIADSMGNYRFTTTEKGSFLLQFTSTGYKSFEQQITIGNTAMVIDAVLKEELNELKAVTVTAGSFAAGDNKRAATVLTSLDVLTVGGGNADITSAVKTLPGAQQIGEQEGLFVRGGTGAETKQFIDGTLVNNPYYSSVPDIASRGRFLPMLFKGTVFSTGGYSALYGQALSSALILESIDLPEKSTASLGISPIVVNGGFQQLAKNKKSSWGVNYNYVNLIAYFSVVKQTPDYFKMPVFHNADANFRFKTKSGGMIKYYTTFAKGNVGLRRADIDSLELKDAFGLKNINWYNNLSWRENLGHGWKMNLGAGYSTNTDDLTQEIQDQQNKPAYIVDQPWSFGKNFVIKNKQELSQIRAVFEKKMFGISTVRFGGEYMYSVNNTNFNDTFISNLQDHYEALFAETDIYITNDLAAKIGGRFEHSSIINKANIAPRISLAYKVGKGGQISAAYGIFYQKPEYTELAYTTALGYTKATHYILNYQKNTNDRIFRIEGFYKQYDALVKSYPINFYYSRFDNGGSGYAKGIELFFRDKKTIKNLDYWVSYSYLDTKRDFMNYPEQLQPDFAANHTASLVVKRFVINWKTGFNFTYSYATGRPYYNFMYNNDNGTSKFSIADQGKTKDYHNLGFSMNYVPSVGKTNSKVFWVIVASVTNVLGYDAVYGYNYSQDGTNKVPVTPPAKRFFFIGAFFSWGVDRTQDAINGNL
ncbi:TonB-dependent receptor [Panacibacter ginsenosidivorans]|uniref:TonB-dependent receptor n=1 Tax=Panacibacter ginsenosidivorans TaxID=1813871 RepID=A0A5B8V834_9BACT|nr:TonB-dependent receptor [Panacibacter ginsenosidivorans]QEC67647.1 TonB-dependent receptor [Panacibacter ginsenosidivorans]